MRQRLQWMLLGTAVTVLPLMACSQTNKAATEVQSAAQAQVNPTLSTSDTYFINQAAAGGLAEVRFGELAASKASSPAVRRFAQQMVSAHSQLNTQLTQIAQNKQISPPSTIDPPHQQSYDDLQKLHGRAFDKAYIDGQVQDHQTTLQLFQQESQSGTDPAVKAFAANNTDIIQQHLTEAEHLAARYNAPARRGRHSATRS